MKQFFLAFFILLPLYLSAQDADTEKMTVSGKVIENTSAQPVPGANIVIKSNARMKGFSAADADGNFSIIIPKGLPDLSVTVSAVGYKTYTSPLDTVTSPLTIILEDGALQLKEVVVKSRSITTQGDTVTYHVGNFAQSQDRSIGDVLKRMPGIDVEDSGKIKYQGTDINRFYIEGSDLLGGKYGIATNGISYQDVGAVEVMENHQPMRVLQGFGISEQAAINLKLKDKAKATLTGHGKVGGGWATQPHGAVWEADLFGMMIMGKYQNITTLKANNTGERVSDQLTNFYLDRAEEKISPYLSLSLPVPPELRLKSTYLNRSWMVSTNNLWKVGDGSDMKLQLDYLNDRVTTNASTRTIYYLPDGEQVVAEDRSSLAHTNALTAKLSTEINRKTFYLTNVLDADFSWNDTRLDVEGSLSNSQKARTPEFYVGNLLKVMKRFKGTRLVTFISRNEWRSLPERLGVTAADGSYSEKIGQHSFYTDERASFGLVLSKVHLEMEGGIIGFFRSFKTDINDAGIIPDNNSSSISTDYLRIFLSPSFKWEHRRIEAQLRLPLNLYSYFFSSGIRNRTEFFFNPSLNLAWKPAQGLRISLGGNISRHPASLHAFHTFPVLTDYRHVSSGTTDYSSSAGESVSLNLQWRHIPSGIFLNATAMRRWNKLGYESVQNVEGDFVFSSLRASKSSGEMTILRGDISTSLRIINGIAGVKGSFIQNDSRLISQGMPSSMNTKAIYLAPFLNGAVSGYVNWGVKFAWQRGTMKIAHLTDNKTDNFIWTASLTVSPLKWLLWHTTLDHYRMQTAGGYINMPMLDSRLTFRIGKRIDLTAGVSNIFNKKDFSYSSYGVVAQYERHSMLRGRELLISVDLKK
ncbi:MAG: TonB-dependent receptor [Muribaculaceae bacterium]|nr:TonB-dependent receptor [Muribaculaceae bacterium]